LIGGSALIFNVSQFTNHSCPTEEDAMAEKEESLKKGRVAQAIGTFQARVLLTLIYAILVVPFGVIIRLFSDPLHIRRRPTCWCDHRREPLDLKWARRQR
jgi:hypothetical protein